MNISGLSMEKLSRGKIKEEKNMVLAILIIYLMLMELYLMEL